MSEFDINDSLVEANRSLVKQARKLQNRLLDIEAACMVLVADARKFPSGDYWVSAANITDLQRAMIMGGE